MSIIAKLKSSVFEKIFSKNISTNLVGLRIFQFGVLLLAAAPAIAFLLLLISSIFGGLKREKNYFNKFFSIINILKKIIIIVW